MTLYTRNLDTAGTSTCTGSCVVIWLPYAPPSTSLSLPGNATGSLGLIVRDDGTLQVIYNGMPLYLYTGDFKAGDANGAGISDIFQVALP
jgi:predicted lipoprotein with Yx(FWY)xxD motif